MLRALLGLTLLLIAFAGGYYLGRTSGPSAPAGPAAQEVPNGGILSPQPPAPAGNRARSMETPPPPQVQPSTPNVDPSANPALEPLPSAPQGTTLREGDPSGLMERRLGLPIANLKPSDIHDTYHEARGGGERRHEATDIIAPRGTPVLAVDNGIVRRLFNSKPGGLTVYQFDSTERYCFYYAHLDGYAEGLREGMLLKRGDRVGYVGTTGNADPNTPHLHFAIFELGPEKRWYQGAPLNPYPILMRAFHQN